MDDAAQAKQLVDLARKNIEDRQGRIQRQRELIAKCERDNRAALTLGARRVLERMLRLLARMTAAMQRLKSTCLRPHSSSHSTRHDRMANAQRDNRAASPLLAVVACRCARAAVEAFLISARVEDGGDISGAAVGA